MPLRTRIKICGITRVEDAEAAVRAGVDAIGLIFARQSPRCVATTQAVEIVRAAGPFVSIVGLFMDADAADVRQTLKAVPLHLLQFHGSETPEQCRMYDLPYLKAVRMQPDVDLAGAADRYCDAAALVLDTFVHDVAGGTGQTFDWSRVPRHLAARVVLAGGLTPDNVAAAVRRARPYAVDVSSGVEKAKGVKDAAKIEAFVQAVKQAT
jgi:phosphoribosylanthranilate isomerase